MTYNLPSNLEYLLSIHKLTRAEFGKLIDDSSQAAVSSWVKGVNKPSLDKLMLMSEYFEMGLDTLVSGDARGWYKSTGYDRFVSETNPHLLSDKARSEYGVDKDQIIAMLQERIKDLKESLPDRLAESVTNAMADTIDKVDELHSTIMRPAVEKSIRQKMDEVNKNQIKSKNKD